MLKQCLKAGLYIQCKRASLARKNNCYSINCGSIRNASSKNHDVDDDFDKPIQYSTSSAATWTAAKSRNPLGDRHPYESSVVSTSLIVFMLYFFILREENDIDILFTGNLAERLPDMNDNVAQPMSQSK